MSGFTVSGVRAPRFRSKSRRTSPWIGLPCGGQSGVTTIAAAGRTEGTTKAEGEDKDGKEEGEEEVDRFLFLDSMDGAGSVRGISLFLFLGIKIKIFC